MKRYAKEIVIVLLQAALIYGLPPLLYLNDPIGGMVLLLISAALLSAVLGLWVTGGHKLAYPVVVAGLFAGSIGLYYNHTATPLIGYFMIVSALGLGLGYLVRFLWKKVTHKG